jgi:hypothetical protein
MMKWVEYVILTWEIWNAYNTLVKKPEEKKLRGCPRPVILNLFLLMAYFEFYSLLWLPNFNYSKCNIYNEHGYLYESVYIPLNINQANNFWQFEYLKFMTALFLIF